MIDSQRNGDFPFEMTQDIWKGVPILTHRATFFLLSLR